jgi:hypothetical protein
MKTKTEKRGFEGKKQKLKKRKEKKKGKNSDRMKDSEIEKIKKKK